MASRKWLIIAPTLVVVVAALVITFALRRSAPKHDLKRYEMTGVVLGVKPEARKVTVANDAIANFMEPMVMEYDVKDAAVVPSIERGDDIRATLVSDGANQWVLEDLAVSPRR